MPGASHTSTWKANARGVDLNRNSNSHFRANYGGKEEVKDFRDHLLQVNLRQKQYLNY